MSLASHIFNVMELVMKVGLFTIPLAFATCIVQSAWIAKGPFVTKTPALALALFFEQGPCCHGGVRHAT